MNINNYSCASLHFTFALDTAAFCSVNWMSELGKIKLFTYAFHGHWKYLKLLDFMWIPNNCNIAINPMSHKLKFCLFAKVDTN